MSSVTITDELVHTGIDNLGRVLRGDDPVSPEFALAEWAAGESGAYIAGCLTAIAEQTLAPSGRMTAVTFEAARRVFDEPEKKVATLTDAVTRARTALAVIVTALRTVDYPHEAHLELDDILEDALADVTGEEATGDLAPVDELTVDEARVILGFQEPAAPTGGVL